MVKTTQMTRKGLPEIQALVHKAIPSLQAILEAMPDRIPDTRITMAARKLTTGLSSRRERGGGQDEPNDREGPTRRQAPPQISDHDPGSDPGGNAGPEDNAGQRQYGAQKRGRRPQDGPNDQEAGNRASTGPWSALRAGDTDQDSNARPGGQD